ncbi:hypothetical protein AB1Y20_012732 [Prymnesium parvum]|uniref:Fibronectin type-III domain-containing protein n=1 Tax=Prymnesium parvum TaxID=97485 RepID=A0AB34IJA6_PRYPA
MAASTAAASALATSVSVCASSQGKAYGVVLSVWGRLPAIDPTSARLPALREAASPAVEIVRVLPVATKAPLDGLRPATAYEIRVAARNVVGWGDWSKPLKISTLPARLPPLRPDAPVKLEVSDGDRCDKLCVQLPIPRGGCSGDSSLELQLQPPDSKEWHTAPGELGLSSPQQGSRRMPIFTISSLDAYNAYKLRLVARNSMGTAFSDIAGPWLSGAGADSLFDPPKAQAIASFVYRLSWGGSSTLCRAGLSWDVQYRRSAKPLVAAGERSSLETKSWGTPWVTHTTRLTTRHADIVGLHCPEGCSFRVKVQGVVAQDEIASQGSVELATVNLPPVDTRGARVEMVARRSSSNVLPDTVPLVDDIERRLANALGVRPRVLPLQVQEAVAVPVLPENPHHQQVDDVLIYMTINFSPMHSPYPKRNAAAHLAEMLNSDAPTLEALLDLRFDLNSAAVSALMAADFQLRKHQMPFAPPSVKLMSNSAPMVGLSVLV